MNHGYSGIGPGMAHGICRDKKKPSPLFEAGCSGLSVRVRCSRSVFTFGVHVDLDVSMFQCLCSSFW